MDKIKTYEELLNRALDSLIVATYYDHMDMREADKLYDDIKKALKEPETETDDNWISVDDRLTDKKQKVSNELNHINFENLEEATEI